MANATCPLAEQFQYVVIVKEMLITPQHSDPHWNAPTRSDYIPAMGFNKRKMEDARKTEADKEATARRGLGPQILADARVSDLPVSRAPRGVSSMPHGMVKPLSAALHRANPPLCAKGRVYGMALVTCGRALQRVIRDVGDQDLRVGFGLSVDICVAVHECPLR